MHPTLKTWVDWWHARRSHIFPPFRGFGFAEVNMAEAGNSTIQESAPLMLADCAKVDCAMYLNQDANYQAFLDNEGQSTGRGPNLVSRADDDRRGQMSRAKQFSELFRNRNMDSELEQFNNPSQFISSRKTSHKSSNKRNGVQDKHVQEKPKKAEEQTEQNQKADNAGES